jgi:hypothetical protein
LRRWVLDVARSHPLLIAIDDLPSVDEPSLAFASLLAQDVSQRGIAIAATGTGDRHGSYVRGALELFASASTLQHLEPLTTEQTCELLRSVFGDVPNVASVASHVQRVTAGNPRDVMLLAQHLVSEGAIRYRTGSWTLPSQFHAAVLPSSMTDALRARVEKLSDAARSLARGLAGASEERFDFEECALLLPHASHGKLLQALDELVEAQVVQSVGDRYVLGERGWSGPLGEGATPAQSDARHVRLAEIYRARGDDFREAHHLLLGRELERGLDALIDHARSSEALTDVNPSAYFELLQSLPRDWLATYELGLAECARQNRPAKQRDALLSRLAGLLSPFSSEVDGQYHIQERLEALARAAGLDLYAEQPASLDVGARIKKALEGAGARFAQTPEHDRIYDPGAAIKQLTKTTLAGFGVIAYSLDYEAWARMPSLAPYAPIAPVLAVVEQLSQGLGARITGRYELAVTVYQALLARIGQPDRGGLEPSHHLTATVRVKVGVATLEATLGRASCLQWASEVETETAFETQGLLIRHLYHVWQGDSREASNCKRQIELRQIEGNTRQGFEGQHLLQELCAYALAGDMTRVKRAADASEPRARTHRAWRPILHYGRGEYLRISGDHAAALRELEVALSLMQPGCHQVWANTAGAHLRCLLGLERYQEAKQLAAHYLHIADERGLGYVQDFVRMPLALALSKLGEQVAAVELAQSVIDGLLGLGASGLMLAIAHETRAQIAMEGGDQEGFDRHAALFAEQWRSGDRRLIGSRYERTGEVRDDDDVVLEEFSVVSQFTSMLEVCMSSAQRARCGLEYLGRQSGAIGGVLYTNSEGGLVRSASFGELESSAELDQRANDYFLRELEEDEGTAVFSGPPPATSEPTLHGDRHYVPVLLTHQSERGLALTGVALLLSSGSAFTYPSRVAAELSRCVADSGDVTIEYV